MTFIVFLPSKTASGVDKKNLFWSYLTTWPSPYLHWIIIMSIIDFFTLVSEGTWTIGGVSDASTLKITKWLIIQIGQTYISINDKFEIHCFCKNFVKSEICERSKPKWGKSKVCINRRIELHDVVYDQLNEFPWEVLCCIIRLLPQTNRLRKGWWPDFYLDLAKASTFMFLDWW